MAGVYLVTGTSSGIGEYIVRELLKKASTKVVGISRRSASASLKAEAAYSHVEGDVTDVSVQKHLVDVISQVVKSEGRAGLDGAVFNAGILDDVTAIRNLDPELKTMRRVFDVNYFSVVSLTTLLLPLLRNQRGRAIYVSSGASSSGYQAWLAYGSSKAALNLFVKTLAIEEPDVTSLAVAPGVVDTDMQTLIRSSHATNGEMKADDGQKFIELKAGGKLVKPEDSGRLYANIVQEVDSGLSGEYLRYNDPKLASYA